VDQFIVEKEVQFDAGHRVPNHKSKCCNPHGHRYRVVVGVSGDLVSSEGASDQGMVMDFGDIKALLTAYVHDVYDHGFMVYMEDITMRELASLVPTFKWVYVAFIPTAENLARSIYDNLAQYLSGLAYVKVWETPTSMAMYPGGAQW
jgi:6-pyruvoyltetrahydropterin/6-carboxytetrahydropterin synthase